MPANTNPIFLKIPKVNFGELTTANTLKNGTGAVIPLFTGGENGSKVEKVTFIPTGVISADTIRLFINNGESQGDASKNILYKEIKISVYDGNTQAPETEVELNLVLPPNYKLYASINSTPTNAIATTAEGGDY